MEDPKVSDRTRRRIRRGQAAAVSDESPAQRTTASANSSNATTPTDSLAQRRLEPSSSLSSFFSVPDVVITGVGLAPFGNSVGRRAYDYARGLLGLGRDAASSELLKAVVTAGSPPSGILAHVWAILRLSAFRSGTARSAIPYFAAAVVFNHARRTLWFGHGGAGFFLLPQPDEDWRLALARPDVFLEGALAAAEGGGGGGLFGGGGSQLGLPLQLISSAMQKRVWDVLAGGCTALFLAADDAALVQRADNVLRGIVAASPTTTAIARTLVHRAKDVAAVVFLVWLFSCVEFAVAQASATLVLGYAGWALLFSAAKRNPALLRRILSDHWPSAVLLAWMQLAVYPATGLLPLVADSGFVRTARHRQPGVLLALTLAAATMYVLLRYRSRLYIAIETSGLFVFLGFAGVSALLLGAHRMGQRAEIRRRKARP